MRCALLLLQFAFYIGTYAETFYPGCIVFCGAENDACLNKCAQAAVPRVANPEKDIQMEFIAKLPTKSEITGSDMFETRRDGLVYFTTREGEVWRFIPKPTANVTALTKVYSLPPDFRLDTQLDKGLYDIAFLRNFARTRAFYLCFAAKPPMGSEGIDHVLTVAEFVILDDEIVAFSKIFEELPQTVPYRSGGFMKGMRNILGPLDECAACTRPNNHICKLAGATAHEPDTGAERHAEDLYLEPGRPGADDQWHEH